MHRTNCRTACRVGDDQMRGQLKAAAAASRGSALQTRDVAVQCEIRIRGRNILMKGENYSALNQVF